jgi:3-oxoacyl-[acyl-carrier protein] reductase
LAADGVRVVFTYRHNADMARQLAEEVGGVAVRADHEDPDCVEAMFAPVADGLDILVNNAAITVRRPIAEATAADFDRVMTVNAKVPMLAMGRAARLLRDNGRIVNVSTLNTVLPAPGLALYCASKAALEQFTAVAARELGPRGITVNTVSPGATDTDLLRSSNPPEALETSAALTALGRLGQPADVASVIALLVGPDAGWITGQNIRATGGLLV